jgi:hypothetical protein
MDDHQLGDITKLKKKATLAHTTHLSSSPPYPLKENFHGVLMVFLLTFTRLLAPKFQPCLLASFFTTQGNTHEHRK